MVVQHNMTALNANRMLGNVVTQQSKSTEKLASGYRINRAGDDAAGLAISEKMRGQIRGLNQASANAQDGISLIQTAEGALTETHSILQRMRELAVQASSDTNTDDDRTQIQNEINQLTSEVDRIASTTEFNTKKLLDGSKAGSVSRKDGTVKIDGSFGNATVDAKVTVDGSKNAAFSDVIALKVNKDFTEGQSTKGTTKVSKEALEDIYNMLQEKITGNVTAEAKSIEFKLNYVTASKNKTVVKYTDTVTKTLDQRIDDRIASEKNDLTAIKAELTKAQTADKANEGKISSLVAAIKGYCDSEDNFNIGKNALKDNVTSDELIELANKYVDELVKAGATNNGAITEKATGNSTVIESIKDEIKGKFNVNADSSWQIKKAISESKIYKINVLKSDNSAMFTEGNIATSIATNTVKNVANDFVNDIFAIAEEIAGTKIDANRYQQDIDKEEKLIETLENKDLVKSAFNYFSTKYDYTEKYTNSASDELKKQLDLDLSVAEQELDKVNKDEDIITVNDLFSNSETKKTFDIATNVDKNNNLTITLKGKEDDDDTVITISNADKLKAGDKLTITTSKMVESRAAATGEDAIHLQIGANASQEMLLGINSMRARDLNIVQTKEGKEGQALCVSNQDEASLAINAYDLALQKVSTERANMGAIQNRLEHTISNLNTSSENLQTAESRIRDTDMASEMVAFSKNNIIQQAAQSMLAQANQSNAGVLSLIG